MVHTVCYLYFLHPDFYTSDLMGNFFNNRPNILKLIIRVRIYFIYKNVLIYI